MSHPLDKHFADLTKDARLRGATESHAYDIEQAWGFIHLNKQYLTPDDLPALRLLTEIAERLSDKVLAEIENDKEMKLPCAT